MDGVWFPNYSVVWAFSHSLSYYLYSQCTCSALENWVVLCTVDLDKKRKEEYRTEETSKRNHSNQH